MKQSEYISFPEARTVVGAINVVQLKGLVQKYHKDDLIDGDSSWDSAKLAKRSDIADSLQKGYTEFKGEDYHKLRGRLAIAAEIMERNAADGKYNYSRYLKENPVPRPSKSLWDPNDTSRKYSTEDLYRALSGIVPEWYPQLIFETSGKDADGSMYSAEEIRGFYHIRFFFQTDWDLEVLVDLVSPYYLLWRGFPKADQERYLERKPDHYFIVYNHIKENFGKNRIRNKIIF